MAKIKVAPTGARAAQIVTEAIAVPCPKNPSDRHVVQLRMADGRELTVQEVWRRLDNGAAYEVATQGMAMGGVRLKHGVCLTCGHRIVYVSLGDSLVAGTRG
jgi:glycerate kinase